jgi:hypothetical protein
MTISDLSISAKNLGYLAMPDACPRCFWIKTHTKLPYQIFPGIFSSIDSYTKKVTNLNHSKHKKLPTWIEAFCGHGVPLDVPGYSRFCVCHRQTGVVLTGVPDEMVLTDEGLWILDYKTARFTANADSLLPMYRCQLNGYGLIAETLGYGPVVGLGLIYYEPQTDIGTDDVDSVTLADGFTMDFKSHVLPIEIDAGLVPDLLAKARDIFDLDVPPDSREGCKDCEMLTELNVVLHA